MHMPRRAGTPRTVTARVLAILEAFRPAAELSLNEISRRASLPLSTTFRLVNELRKGGDRTRDDDRRYRIGPRLRDLAA
jgi:DNA-binding IclR family transcriptional regulator